MYSYNKLHELSAQYDPNHDIGQNAPVQYQTNVLIAALRDAISEINELKERLDRHERNTDL